MLNYNDIITAYLKAGVQKGDVLCVQSSYKGLGKINGGPPIFINALLDLLGNDGTLLMPTYNFKSWTEGHYFDVKETSSEVGILGEYFRKMDGVMRTQHPIHSFAVTGKLKNVFCSIDEENSFGENSIFSFLFNINAKYSTVGLGLEMPFLPCHYAEKVSNVPYRRTKFFSGIYVGYNQKPKLKTYSLDVRKDEFMTKTTPIYETHLMQYEMGAFKKIEHNNVPLFIGNAVDYHESLLKLISENKQKFGWV